MTYNRAVQKKNARNLPQPTPHKLALFVAAALAGVPVHAAPVLPFATYLGSTTSTDADDGGFMKFDAGGFVHYARVNLRPGDRTVLVVSKLNPATGANSYAMRLDDDAGGQLAGLALGPGGTTYVAGTTVTDGLYKCTTTACNIVGATGDIGGHGEAYVLAINEATGNFSQVRYLGGSGAEQATGIAVDTSGNVYVTGTTRSADFPATVGNYHGGTDVFVARYSPDLSTRDMVVLLGGSGDETSSGIAVDPSGNIYVAMNGGIEDFPPDRPGAPVNAYLVKLGPDGAFQHSTFVGASGHTLAAVQLDAAAQPVVVGTRAEFNDSSVDAFMARISDAGDLLGETPFGGGGFESVRGLTVAGDSIYVVGETFSADFPSIATPTVGASGGSEAFVTRFGPQGLEFSTRFGGSSDEYAQSVGVAPNGDIYLMGSTQSSDFPISPDATRHSRIGPSDLFLARLSSEFDLSSAAFSIASDETSGFVRITRAGSLAGTATIHWAAMNGTAVAGTHYGTSIVPPSGTVTFAPGVGSVLLPVGATVSGPNTIRINPLASFSTPRTFSITLSAPTGGPVLGALATSAVTISQGPSGTQLEQAAISVLENAGSVAVRVKRAPGSALAPATVNYATANGTALAGTHYTSRTGTLTWGAGDDTVKEVAIPITNNNVANAARTFRFVLSAPTGAPIIGGTTATVTILDEDNTIALATAAQAAAEGNPSVTLQVRRTGSPALPASVQWATENVTAVAGADFGPAGVPAALTGTLAWDAGDLTVRNIVIPLLDDGTPEPVKTFKVNLSGVSGATLGTATTTVTLNDNERGFAFQSPEYSVTEGQPSVVLAVRRLGAATGVAVVNWTTSNGTATAGLDFGAAGNAAQRSGTLAWAIGDTANKSITIPIIDDATFDEPAETFTVTITTPTAGYSVGNPSVATVTINENDFIPQSAVQFGQPKYLVAENAGTVTLEVVRTDVGGGFGREARVNYATQPGTALAASDYVTKSGSLVWPAGDSTPKQVTVTIVNDTVAEATESFRVTLSAPTAGTALGATAQASVTILDDDEKFPPHGTIPDGFSVPVDATRGWHVAGDAGAYEGVYALKSDEIDDGESAAVQMEGMFAGGNVSFRVRVSSEPNFDALRFYVDGELQTSWSGTAVAGWQMSPTYVLDPGHHVLRWEYAKDASLAVGQDAAYIDALVTPGFTP